MSFVDLVDYLTLCMIYIAKESDQEKEKENSRKKYNKTLAAYLFSVYLWVYGNELCLFSYLYFFIFLQFLK